MSDIRKLPNKPNPVRVHAFFDGQNLFNSAKECFGYTWPNYDPKKLAQAVTDMEPDRVLTGTHFYTGVHDAKHNAPLHAFWTNKLLALRHAGVHVEARRLQYIRKQEVVKPGETKTVYIAHEKGIDLRLGIDLLMSAINHQFDTAIIFTQDSDLVEVVNEIRKIQSGSNRWLKIESAFPYPNPDRNKRRGLTNTNWRKITQTIYDSCIDPTDYRPKIIKS